MSHNNYPAGSVSEQAQMQYYPEVRITPNGAEFEIGGTKFAYLGGSERGQLFNSVGPDGLERPILVYDSQSQGSARVSQGYESYQKQDGSTGQRLLKGRELNSDAQYTQDTQLHPEFEAAVARISESSKKLSHVPSQSPRHYDEKGADWLMKDFEAQTAVYPLGSVEVDKALTELKAGHLSKQEMKKLTGLDPDTQPADVNYVFSQKIHALNELLESSGIMPDFNIAPNTTQVLAYPGIGNVVKDTYIKVIDGVRYEWQMAHVHNGKAAWIERIRFADAEISAYGTDKQLVNSGILTSKPHDYSDQCDGLSVFMKKDLGNSYSDITPFLALLAPVANYANTYQDREQFYHFAKKAA